MWSTQHVVAPQETTSVMYLANLGPPIRWETTLRARLIASSGCFIVWRSLSLYYASFVPLSEAPTVASVQFCVDGCHNSGEFDWTRTSIQFIFLSYDMLDIENLRPHERFHFDIS